MDNSGKADKRSEEAGKRGEADESDKEDNGAVEGAQVQYNVKLAHIPCVLSFLLHISLSDPTKEHK